MDIVFTLNLYGTFTRLTHKLLNIYGTLKIYIQCYLNKIFYIIFKWQKKSNDLYLLINIGYIHYNFSSMLSLYRKYFERNINIRQILSLLWKYFVKNDIYYLITEFVLERIDMKCQYCRNNCNFGFPFEILTMKWQNIYCQRKCIVKNI